MGTLLSRDDSQPSMSEPAAAAASAADDSDSDEEEKVEVKVSNTVNDGWTILQFIEDGDTEMIGFMQATGEYPDLSLPGDCGTTHQSPCQGSWHNPIHIVARFSPFEFGQRGSTRGRSWCPGFRLKTTSGDAESERGEDAFFNPMIYEGERKSM